MSGYAEWSPATAYAVNDIVYWQGVVYVCIAININQQPPNATYWAAQGGAAGVSSLNGLQGGVNITSPDASVGVAVAGQNVQLTVAPPAAGVSSLNGLTGALTVIPGQGITVGTVGLNQVRIGSIASTAAFTDSVSINPIGGINAGSTFTVPATGIYIISVFATFGGGAGATPIELDETVGNYIQVRFRNNPPGATFDGFCSVPAPPTIAAPGVGNLYFTQNTSVVSWTGGVDKEFQVQVQNAGAGGISWDTASSSVSVTIVQLA